MLFLLLLLFRRLQCFLLLQLTALGSSSDHFLWRQSREALFGDKFDQPAESKIDDHGRTESPLELPRVRFMRMTTKGHEHSISFVRFAKIDSFPAEGPVPLTEQHRRLQVMTSTCRDFR